MGHISFWYPDDVDLVGGNIPTAMKKNVRASLVDTK
jgi:hypothetical protein